MYLAELHGKLPSKIERMEDILTSNVFSFFKYSNRQIFLKGYLKQLGVIVSDQEANDAEFIFWPRFEENTEPDLVIIVGDYYLVIEAKYYSGFIEESEKSKAQLVREIEGGKLEASNLGKNLKLILITKHHTKTDFHEESKIDSILTDFTDYSWTNWQSVSSFLANIFESTKEISKQEIDFAWDLYILLDKKNLRNFQGFDILSGTGRFLITLDHLFFEAETAKFRGDFIGYLNSLSFDQNMVQIRDRVFFGI